MNLNEPVHQDSTSDISKGPGQVSAGHRVLCLSSLQGKTTKQQADAKYFRDTVSVCTSQSSRLSLLYATSDGACIPRMFSAGCSILKKEKLEI